jgi:hypothetical protein
MSPETRDRLRVQGFDTVDDRDLATVAPWLRLAFALCALVAAVGTAFASPAILLALAGIAALSAAAPVHPFDLIYNYGIRHVTGTGPLPRRGLPSRFGCGMGALMLFPTAWAFSTGHTVAGYGLGSAVTAAALLVAATDICLGSIVYRSIFGWPRGVTRPGGAA